MRPPQPTKIRKIRLLITLQQVRKLFHDIRGEIDQWREILTIPYQAYMTSINLWVAPQTYTGAIRRVEITRVELVPSGFKQTC